MVRTHTGRRTHTVNKPHSMVAHHFEDMDQQREATSLGMWAFLVTEVMFFGGVFAGYAVCYSLSPAAFGEASKKLSVVLGATNTAVLICSSLTMAFAVRSAQLNQRKRLLGFLVATMLLGSVFLGIKAVEYSHKFHEHLVPGSSFGFEGPNAGGAQIFFSFYFAMTGLHALHMIIGIGLMIWLLVKTNRGRFSSEYYSPVENVGLYWHFVDIVWVFLFPLLYLISRA
jgi:cytochrome c oxidase subunit III